jgi:hypothetical protein
MIDGSFGEVCVNILSPVLASKLCVVSVGKLMFLRLLVVDYLPLTLPFTLTFSVVYGGEFIRLKIYQTTRRHTSEGISFQFCTLMTLIYRVSKG